MQFKIKGVISYPHLFQARSVNPGDDPKYSCSVLLHKTDPQVAQVQAIIDTEKANGWPSGFPPKGKIFMKDCAIEFPNEPKVKDYMIVQGNAKIDSKPAVVDANLQPVLDPSQACAGSVAWVAFNTFTYDHAVNKGVGAGLNAVMLTDEMGALGRLDGRPSVESLFGDVVGGAVPAPMAAPAPAPIAAAPAPAPAPAVPQYTMTAAANGLTREAYHASGWTDLQLIQAGLMVSAVPTSF